VRVGIEIGVDQVGQLAGAAVELDETDAFDRQLHGLSPASVRTFLYRWGAM
jgi:hypothetical protein